MRKKAVYEQLGGLDEVTPETEEIFKSLTVQQKLSNRRHWRATSGYGLRVAAEGGFSATKRMFGDGVCSRTPDNVEREIRLMYAIYNNMIDQAVSKGHVGVRVRMQCGGDEGKAGRRRTAGKGRAAARAGPPAGAAAAAAAGRRRRRRRAYDRRGRQEMERQPEAVRATMEAEKG